MTKFLTCLAIFSCWLVAQQPLQVAPMGPDSGSANFAAPRSTLFSSLGGVPATASQRRNVTSQHYNDPVFSPTYYATYGADDFTVPASVVGWQIDRIQVLGSYFTPGINTGTVGTADTINVYIMGNSGGLPDTTDIRNSSLYIAEEISFTENGSGDFDILLPGSGVFLEPGTYWISVQANMPLLTDGQWGWTEVSATPDSGTVNGNESAWLQTPSDFVSGSNSACVNTWNARGTTCNMADTEFPPTDRDFAFLLDGSALTAGVTVTTPGAGVIVSESGGVSSFTVVLDAPPSANVVLALAVSNTNSGEISTDNATYGDTLNLTFTTANWATPQTVFVRGEDDGATAGKTDFSIMFNSITTTDPNYSALSNPSDVSVTQTDNDVAAVLVTPVSGLSVTEAGGTDTFTVQLSVLPTDNVTITLTSSDTGEARLSTDGVTQQNSVMLTFTSANGTTPQTVTIHGQNDDIDDGDIAFNITGVAAGAAEYTGLPVTTVSGVNLDNDTVGVTVTAADPVMTAEPNVTANFTVVLNSEPTADVTIGVDTSNHPEALVTGGSTLTFTSANWNVAQMVTLTGQDDIVDDGDIPYQIVFAALASSDPLYSGYSVAPLNGVNQDDADAADIIITNNGTYLTTEAGGTFSFTVVLGSMPASNVTVPIMSSDTAEGTVSTASLTFTSANWNTPQSVTVTGVDDDIDDGDIPYEVEIGPATSADAAYNGFPVQKRFPANQDDDTAGVTVSTTTLTTSESPTRTTATFTVVLDSEPTADVTITVTSGDTTEGTVSPATLTFTSANWDTPQTVTVTGVDDLVDDGNITYNVTMASASGDTLYSGISVDSVAVTNTDNDTAGVTLSQSTLNTSETGTTATYTVALGSQPTANVTITVTSADTTEGTVSPATLTFTTANYATPQTVTVTGVDDLVDDGNITYNVTHSAASSDGTYNGISINSVSVTNADDDTAGVTVTPTTLTTSETGTTATFTVVLNTMPTATVTVAVTSGDTTEGTVAPASLTFTTGNYATPQTVTVTGVDDAIVDADITYNVTMAATSSDGVYNGISINSVAVTNLNDDICGPVTISVTIGGAITVTGTPGCVFDLYNTHGSSNPAEWTLLASGILIPGSGTVTVPGVTGQPDFFYVATAAGTFDILNANGGPVLTVPTLGEWGLIAFVTLLLAVGVAIMRRQRLA